MAVGEVEHSLVCLAALEDEAALLQSRTHPKARDDSGVRKIGRNQKKATGIIKGYAKIRSPKKGIRIASKFFRGRPYPFRGTRRFTRDRHPFSYAISLQNR
jgi:hypothetical protein